MKRRLKGVEGETASLAAVDQKLEKAISAQSKSEASLEAEVEELAAQVAESEKKSERGQAAAP